MELTSCEAFIKAVNKKIELSKKTITVNILKRDYKLLTTKSEPDNFADVIMLQNQKAIAKDNLVTLTAITFLIIDIM